MEPAKKSLGKKPFRNHHFLKITMLNFEGVKKYHYEKHGKYTTCQRSIFTCHSYGWVFWQRLNSGNRCVPESSTEVPTRWLFSQSRRQTNLDFPEIRGPISLTITTLWGKFRSCFRSRWNLIRFFGRHESTFTHQWLGGAMRNCRRW